MNPPEPLPVMVFIYGGGFKAGTQEKMGFERLGDVNDVVLVAVNYRVGPLGEKQCDQIGAPSVCGGPNSFNSVTP